MKHLILTTLGILALSIASAHNPHRSSSLTFYSHGYFDIDVTINGQRVNRYPSGRIDLYDLVPGKHFVRIKAFGPNQVKHLTQVIYVQPGHHRNIRVSTNGRFSGLYLIEDGIRPVGVRPNVRNSHGHHFSYSNNVQGRRQRHHDSRYHGSAKGNVQHHSHGKGNGKNRQNANKHRAHGRHGG